MANSTKFYGLTCNWCEYKTAIRGRKGHGSAWERLKDHVWEKHYDQRAMLDDLYDEDEENLGLEEIEEQREDWLTRETVGAIPMPDTPY